MSRAETAAPKYEPKQPGSNLWLVIAAMAGCALLLTILFGGHGLMRWLQYDQDKKALNAALEKIEEQNARTRREIDSLINNGKYIETVARRDLGMVKADEIIYQFPSSEIPSGVTQARPEGQ